MFVVRFFTKIDKTLPHCQKSSAQVLQSAPGELGSGAANRSVNPDLICPPYILWPRSVRAGSDPSSPNPRPVITRSQPLLRDLRRRCTSSTRRRPTLYPSSSVAYPSSPVSFFNSRTCRRALQTRRRALPAIVARCRLVVGQCGPVVARVGSVVARCATCRRDPSRTRPAPVRAPYKYARVSLFPRTLSEHPGLHLPRRLLAGFSKGCFIFFIARHPPRLEFREYSAVKSALVILNYLEIKHCFFFNLGILALE